MTVYPVDGSLSGAPSPLTKASMYWIVGPFTREGLKNCCFLLFIFLFLFISLLVFEIKRLS